MTDASDGKRDFFISFTGADRRWARWLARTLAEADYRFWFQDQDFAGSIPRNIEKAHEQSNGVRPSKLRQRAVRVGFRPLPQTTPRSAAYLRPKRITIQKLIPEQDVSLFAGGKGPQGLTLS